MDWTVYAEQQPVLMLTVHFITQLTANVYVHLDRNKRPHQKYSSYEHVDAYIKKRCAWYGMVLGNGFCYSFIV